MSIPRALFFLSDFGGGGAQKTLLNLAGAMPPELARVEFAVVHSRGPAARWVPEGLALHDLNGRGMSGSIPALAQLIRARKPDVVLATMLHANVATWLAVRLSGSGAAVVLRETNSHRARGGLSGFWRRAGAMAYRRAELVVALSEGVRRELVADMALAPERTVTIHNPVEVAGLRARVENARHEASPWPADASGPRILGIGRLVRQKAYEVLVEAVAGQAPEAQLTLLGEGPDRAMLEAQAARLDFAGRLHLPGFVGDVAPWLAHADLFVLSSRWEGFGHVIVEAMAASLPVVATDCPYGPAEILEDGRTGLLVPVEDPQALGRAIRRLLDDPGFAQKLAAAGGAQAARFQSETIARRYGEALGQAVALRAARSASRARTA